MSTPPPPPPPPEPRRRPPSPEQEARAVEERARQGKADAKLDDALRSLRQLGRLVAVLGGLTVFGGVLAGFLVGGADDSYETGSNVGAGLALAGGGVSVGALMALFGHWAATWAQTRQRAG